MSEKVTKSDYRNIILTSKKLFGKTLFPCIITLLVPPYSTFHCDQCQDLNIGLQN